MKFKYITLILFIILLSVNLFAIKNTGDLLIILEYDNKPLPDTSLRLSSEIMMGEKTGVSNTYGKIFFKGLTPGLYKLKAESNNDFFIPETKVIIFAGKTSKVVPQISVTHTIDIGVHAPVLYTQSDNVTYDYDFENIISRTPQRRRHFTAFLGLTPGALRGNNPSVLGAGKSENLYIIDNFSLNDSRTQQWGKQFNVDIIAEASAQVTGIKAEYGRMMGSVMDIVTKSGSNRFHGIARLDMTRPEWNDISQNNPERDDDDFQDGSKEDEWNFSGGGPIIPDTLWWYAGYTIRERLSNFQRNLNPLNPDELTDAVKTYEGHYLSIKGTLQPTSSLKLTGFYLEDPMVVGNAGSYYEYDEKMQPSADETQEEGGEAFSTNVTWILDENKFLEGRWSHNFNRNNFLPQTDNENGYYIASTIVGPSYFSEDDWWWGATPDDIRTKRYRDAFAVSLNWLIDSDSFGYHDIKAGIEYLNEWSTIKMTRYPTGEAIMTGDVEEVGFENAPWLAKYVVTDRLPESENHISYWTFFIQDSIELSDNLTLNIGLRSDMSQAENNQSIEVINVGMFDALAPRLGLAYAIGDHSLYASYSRYYDLLSMYILDDLNTYSTPEKWELYEPTDGIDGRNGWNLINTWFEGNATTPHTIASDLTPQFVDEFSAGFDYVITDNISFGVHGVWRIFKDAVVPQDIDGDHIVNWENLETNAYGSKWKEYFGLTVKLVKRAVEDNLYIAVFYNISSIEGLSNDLGYGNAYGVNPLQRKDNADEWWGPVSTMSTSSKSDSDPTMMLRLQGTYYLPKGFYLSTLFNYDNNYAPNTWLNQYVSGFGKVTIYPNGRGDMERLPGFLDWDIQIGIESEFEIPFTNSLFGDTALFAIYFNLDNLLNDQSGSRVDSYQFSSRYGQTTRWRTAREYLLGFRFEF